LNLEDGYISWNGAISDGDVKDDFAWACCDSYNPVEKIGEFKITIFQKIQECWQRLDITNLVKAYSQAEIISTLISVGFSDISVYDQQANTASAEYNEFAIFASRK
jgi:aminoglycoside phosphotransferase family enzyme